MTGFFNKILDPYGFERMAALRKKHGLEPIDWPRILVNQFRAESLLRELTSYEKFLYNAALVGLHKAQPDNEQ